MAAITQRTNKDGSVVYRIRVYAGITSDGKQQAYQTTFTPDPQKSPSANQKALNRFVYDFEQRCKSGAVTLFIDGIATYYYTNFNFFEFLEKHNLTKFSKN